MARSYNKAKNRSDSGRFMLIPHAVIDSASFSKLSGKAVKVLIYLYKQYNGHNNGDLSAPFSAASALNIGSQSTWYSALDELVDADLITRTRDSMKKGVGNPHGLCTLFAVTWKPIDECQGKLDVSATATAPRKFSLERR